MLGDEILLEEYPFRLIARIELKTDKYGIPIEYHPAKRYENSRSLQLNAHGDKSFCHFALKPRGGLDLCLYRTGVYAIAGTSVNYIGRTQTSLNQRFNGYRSIQPRNCYEGGQSTNCRINNRVLEVSKAGEMLWVYFHETDQPNDLEAYLLNSLVATDLWPPWNISIPSQMSCMGLFQPTYKNGMELD